MELVSKTPIFVENFKTSEIMKTIAKLIYNLFYWIDVKFNLIEEYDYETAPYCGHHFNGHKGKFTHSDYHEGDGGWGLNTKNPFFKIGGNNVGDGYNWQAPQLLVLRSLSLKGERIFMSDDKYYGTKGLVKCLKSSRKAKKSGLTYKLKFKII